MTETDDKLLKQFFGEQKQEIEDNGFSHRVMRNLRDGTTGWFRHGEQPAQ